MAQTKLTLTNLATLAAAYIDANLQMIAAGDFEYDRETYSNLIVKIGKQLMQDSMFTDRLQELSGEELPYGTTIEEYFINLLLAKSWDGTGASALAPDDPIFGSAYYSTLLGRKTYKQTLRDNVFEKAMLGTNEAAAVAAQILKKLNDSVEVTRYGYKRQLLGNLVDKVVAAQTADVTLTMVHPIAKPTTTETAEAFIKKVKVRVTELSEFLTDTNNMSKVIAKADSLILYVKGSGIIPELDVEALAGAFNQDKVEIPVEVKVLEDFGTLTGDANVYAILMDPRSVRLHPHRLNAEAQRNADGEFTNFYVHESYTGYISGYTNVNVFTTTGV